jgi:site-specific DNA-methyltransferase (adenine-specific)
MNIHFSSENECWSTPQTFFDKLNDRFDFTLDPCAHENTAKCKKYFTEKEDGLAQKWTGRVFMNPPYGRKIGSWMKKARESVQNGDCELVVCLVPSRTDTIWFWENIFECDFAKIEFQKGRLVFGTNEYWKNLWNSEFKKDGRKNPLFQKFGRKDAAPFPSVVVIYKK